MIKTLTATQEGVIWYYDPRLRQRRLKDQNDSGSRQPMTKQG